MVRWNDPHRGSEGQVSDDREAGGDLPPDGHVGEDSCGELETLESVSDKRTLGDKWCAVSFSPRAYDYRISGTKAQLQFGAETLDLVKISD